MIDKAELSHLPLFRALSDQQLATLLSALATRDVPQGTVLFTSGDVSSSFQILVSGEVELVEAGEPPITLRPVAPIGELGALTGLPRNATATTTTQVRLLETPREALMDLLSKEADLGVVFLKALLAVVADKVRRDKLRAIDMRANIVRTQKAMKELRELVLSSEETALSEKLCTALDDLIAHNRRARYRVCPVESHIATARLSDGSVYAVVELSEGFVKLSNEQTHSAAGAVSRALFSDTHPVSSEPTFVITLPRGEVPVSGRVERVGADGTLIRLDMLIDEYRNALASYMTELQMLDFVV